jgi:hypothetical protein
MIAVGSLRTEDGLGKHVYIEDDWDVTHAS